MSVRLSDLIAPAFYGVHADMKAFAHSELWLSGGRGSGKSSFVSIEILLSMLRNSSVNAIVYRKVGATLRESVYGQMVWAIEKLGLERYFKCRLAPLELEYLPTGQRILFRGADDPGKSKSIKLARGWFGILWFEELAEFSGMEAIRTIKASVLRGGRAITIYTYNPPKSRNNWVNAEAMSIRADRLTHESSYLEMPEEWLGETFLAEAEQLKRTNERAYRHMYLGEITGTGGQVFDNLALGTARESGGTAFCGLDFGFAADPDAFIRAEWEPRTRRIRVLDEFYSVRTPVERLAEEVLKRAGDAVVRCDSADPRIIRELRERGVNAIAVKKGAGSIESGVRWLQELGAIEIDPGVCPNAAREFSGYEYRTDSNGNPIAELPDRDNHLIDALRYAVEPLSARRSAETVSRAKIGF